MLRILAAISFLGSAARAEEAVIFVPNELRPLAIEAERSYERGDFAHAERLFATMHAKHPRSVWISPI